MFQYPTVLPTKTSTALNAVAATNLVLIRNLALFYAQPGKSLDYVLLVPIQSHQSILESLVHGTAL